MSSVEINSSVYLRSKEDISSIECLLMSLKEHTADYLDSDDRYKKIKKILDLENYVSFSYSSSSNLVNIYFETYVIDESWREIFKFISKQKVVAVTCKAFNNQVGEYEEIGFVDGRKASRKRILDAVSDIDPSYALELATSIKNHKESKRIIESGVDPNKYLFCSPLISVIYSKKSDLVLGLLRNGANPDDDCSSKYLNPLCAALYNEEYRSVDYLLEFGASVNSESCNGFMPLSYAFKSLCIKEVKKLVSYGANVNIHKSDGNPLILDLLCRSDCNDKVKEILEFIIEMGANIDIVDNNKIPVIGRVYNRQIESLLISYGAKKYIPDTLYLGMDQSDLMIAIRHDDRDKVKDLLGSGIDVNSRVSVKGKYEVDYPIYQALAYGRLDVMEMLIKYGANTRVVSENCGGFLAYAIRHSYRDTDVIEYVLSCDIDYEEPDHRKRTPLVLSLEYRLMDVFELLLKKNVYVDIDSVIEAISSFNPITMERHTIEERVRVIKYIFILDRAKVLDCLDKLSVDIDFLYWLVKNGVELLDLNPSTLISAVFSSNNQYKEFLKLLELIDNERVSDEYLEKLFRAVYGRIPVSGGVVDVVCECLFYMLNQDQRFVRIYEKSVYPLFLTRREHVKYLERILECGVNPNLVIEAWGGPPVFSEQVTYLMVVSAYGLCESVELLLKHGADPSMEDADGQTALDFARANKRRKVASLLKSHSESH